MSENVNVEKCLDSYSHVLVNNVLRDKVVFITGGGSGICFSIAEIFLRHGCDGVIVGRNVERLKQSANTLIQTTNRRCLFYQVDVRKNVDSFGKYQSYKPSGIHLILGGKPQDILAAIDETLKVYGKVDYLINGAAGNFLCSLENMSYNAFKTVMDIDTMGTFNTSKAMFDKYFKVHGGVIINITATLHFRGESLQGHAGPAKAAIEALTRHMAVEWGPNKIRTMCVAPGPIADTEGMRKLSGGRRANDFYDVIPIQRIGKRVEIANICLFLVTSMAELLTGTTIIADGGAWLVTSNDFRNNNNMYQAMLTQGKAKL